MRLLVVEDDPDLNRQLTTALTDAGYVVDRAFDGEEGHFLGDSEPYDAVVLDIGLPKMDGISVLEAWRRNKRVMPVLISPRGTAGATRCRGLTPAPTTMSQNRFISRKCWRGSARCCAVPPAMRSLS